MSQVLFSLTVLIHILVVNLLIGGLPVLLFTDWIANRTGQPAYHNLIKTLTRVFPLLLVAGILLGVGTLILSLMRYSSSFYGAGTVMGQTWMFLVPVLIVLLLGLLILKEDSMRLNQNATLRYALGSAILAGLLVVTFLFVSITVLMLVPEYWSTVQSHGLGKLLSLPTVMPRFFHVVVASFAATGCMVMLYGVALHSRFIVGRDLSPSESTDYGIHLTRYGGFWAMAGTVPQIVVGPWLLWTLPEHVRGPLVNGGTFGSIIFFVSLSSALFALVMLNATVVAPQYRWLALGGVGSLLITFGTMIIVREEVRHYWIVGKEDLVNNLGGSSPVMGLWALILILLLGLAMVWFFLKKRVPLGP